VRISIRQYDTDYIVETSHDEVTLTEILCLFGGLLRSAGFSFDGEIDIVTAPQDSDRKDE